MKFGSARKEGILMRKTILAIALMLNGCASVPSAQALERHFSCLEDSKRLEARSKELAEIVKADQDERHNWQSKTPEEMMKVADNDVSRRKREGEIFGEGCFSKAEDYAAAALVYQHGDAPDHFYQTFIWSRRGVELGDKSQERMMALGIDRYLVNIGQRQLFGSQATKPNESKCWCLQRIEKSFPDKRRSEIAGKSLAQALDWLKELNAGQICPISECDADLKPTPRGSVPGFW
jgi:hypothetical protein